MSRKTPRRTRQQAAIFQTLQDAEVPLTPRQIRRRARRQVPTLSQATVYRVLKSLIEAGQVATLDLPDLPPMYERSDRRHHHFFRCRSCDRLFEVRGCAQLVDRLVPEGFVLEEHEVYLAGTCRDCRD